MPKVTLLEPQKSSKGRSAYGGKNPHRFNIFLDGTFAFGADEDLVIEHRLVVGKILDTSDVKKLLFEVEVGKLMERMYRLWNIRPRSEKEIRDYLKSLSFKRKIKDQEDISDAAVELLINKLKQKGLLNDEQFANVWVEARRKSKKKGKIALKMELIQKGINRDIINEAIKQSSEEEQLLAERALEKKIKVWEKLPYLEFKKKGMEFLLRRGFEYDVIKSTIEKILQKRYNSREEE
ncbi:RecX family transcriptional regulator [Candidatus Daviesbacteria bacterium]|nr:RecX family transcriptional regulator [Candidatus Daviesbacteria bacterium]